MAGFDNPGRLAFGPDGDLYVSGSGIKEIARFGTAIEAVFTVSLSAPSSQMVVVDYTTNPSGGNPASEGLDYEGATGQVVFLPGQMQRMIFVPMIDDLDLETDETFEISISLPTGGPGGIAIQDSTGIGTIKDNELPNVPPTANAGVDQTLNDDDSSGGETVTLNGSGTDSDGPIVSYAWTEGSTPLGSTASISPSLLVGTHTLTLTVTDDDGATATDTVVVIVAPAGISSTKFYVVDDSSMTCLNTRRMVPCRKLQSRNRQ